MGVYMSEPIKITYLNMYCLLYANYTLIKLVKPVFLKKNCNAHKNAVRAGRWKSQSSMGHRGSAKRTNTCHQASGGMVNDVSHSWGKRNWCKDYRQEGAWAGKFCVAGTQATGAVERHEARKHSREPTMNGDFIPESTENEWPEQAGDYHRCHLEDALAATWGNELGRKQSAGRNQGIR